jgi:hypothetical protein
MGFNVSKSELTFKFPQRSHIMHSGLLRCIGLLHGLPIHIPKLIPCLTILCVLVPYLFCIWWLAP